ncbi:Nucleic-acid-binding protein from transposon X-element [Anthophora plagiata]
MVLKGLLKINSEDILEELKAYNLNPIACREIQRDISAEYPAYKITFAPRTTPQQIRKIGYIYKSRIYWEKYDSKKPFIQCYRCQAHGHTSANCNKNPNCVKCAGNHPTKECSKTRDTPAKCYNCKGDHPANYSQCPALLAYLNERKAHTHAQPPTALHHNIPNQSTVQYLPVPEPPRRNPASQTLPIPSPLLKTYAQIAAQKTQQPQPTDNPTFQDDLAGINGLFSSIKQIKSLCNLEIMLTACRQLVSKLQHCKTNSERLMTFLEVTSNLDD